MFYGFSTQVVEIITSDTHFVVTRFKQQTEFSSNCIPHPAFFTTHISVVQCRSVKTLHIHGNLREQRFSQVRSGLVETTLHYASCHYVEKIWEFKYRLAQVHLQCCEIYIVHTIREYIPLNWKQRNMWILFGIFRLLISIS